MPPPDPTAVRTKRSDVTAAELAAERTQIALAALGPRLEALVRSGDPGSESVAAWRAPADDVRGELARSLIANAGVRVSALTCFRAGCSFSFDAANEAAEVQAAGRLKMLLRGELPNPFSGDTFVSGSETRPDGYLRTTVILYAPQATNGSAAAK